MFLAMDLFETIRLFDNRSQDEIASRFPMLAAADLNDAMYVVTEDGALYGGFHAFRRIIWSSPFTWLFVPLFYLPGSVFFGERAYAWVARNRRRIGCVSASCELPDARNPAKRKNLR